jgi:hypothetical protein
VFLARLIQAFLRFGLSAERIVCRIHCFTVRLHGAFALTTNVINLANIDL